MIEAGWPGGVRLLLALVVAAGAAYLLTPVAIQAAVRWDFYDRPNGYRAHASATPYLGGASVLAAFLVALALLAGDPHRTLPIVGGTLVLWSVGTIDDRRTVSPSLRVLIEVALGVMLWACGLGWHVGAGNVVDIAATALWVVAVVNAINLFDNMDGASSAIALVVSAAVCALGVIQDDPWLATAGAALAGSCLGFLPYNLARPSARIFLGDGGSMPLGFAVAALVMTGVSERVAVWQALGLGLMLVAVPALDTTLVIVSRRRRGISILTGGRDHLTHRTRRRMPTAHSVALTLGAAQAIVASVALVAVNGGSIAIVLITSVLLAVAGGVIAVLEREEDRLRRAGELAAPTAVVARTRGPSAALVGDVVLGVFAIGAAISPLFFGYYASTAWVPLGLGVLVVAAMGTIRRPPELSRRGWIALAALAGTGLLSVLSSSWAASVEQAVVDGNRWLVLTAVLGLALVMVRTRRRELVAVGGLGLGILVVAAVVAARMLGGDGADLFLGDRLNAPLGYVNGEATVFVMGVWLAFAAVERRHAIVAGTGLAAATWLAGLALLSQSRGAALAAVASAAIVLVAAPGRVRRSFALLTLGAGLLLAHGPLLHVYTAAQHATGSSPPESAVHHAAVVLLLCGIATGAVWGGVTFAYEQLANRAGRRGARIACRALLAGIVVIALAAAVVDAGRIGHSVNRQWTAFTHLQHAGGGAAAGSRLLSGSGNRYDYWRVAWHAFTAHPVGGLGAGNFDTAWRVDRRVSEDVTNPHSIELQALSELGVVGGLLLAAFIGALAVGVALVRRRRGALAATGVACTGVVSAWLVHTSVDWQHLIPGVTAVALIAGAVLLRPDRELESPARLPTSLAGRGPRIAIGVAIAAVVAITGALLAREGLADHYRNAAADAVVTDPRRAIDDADRALRLDADDVSTYYTKAAALARLDAAAPAQDVLLAATRREPRNPVTWVLLGDLETRRGALGAAHRYYARALALDPLEPGLRALAAHGASR